MIARAAVGINWDAPKAYVHPKAPESQGGADSNTSENNFAICFLLEIPPRDFLFK